VTIAFNGFDAKDLWDYTMRYFEIKKSVSIPPVLYNPYAGIAKPGQRRRT
jgi:hypothetical protein